MNDGHKDKNMTKVVINRNHPWNCASVNFLHNNMRKKRSSHRHNYYLVFCLTDLLFPHSIGCSPAHSCTNAENWEWGFSASSFFFPPPAAPPPPSAPSSPSSPGTSVVLGPQVVALRDQVMFVGEAGVRPMQAPLGSRRARPESRSTSLRSLSTSVRSFNKAPRWDWDRGTK